MSAPRTERADVLVLDAEQRAALAIVRSLGRHKLRVATASSATLAIGGASRYSRVHVQLPDLFTQPAEYSAAVAAAAQLLGVTQVWPVTDATIAVLIEHPLPAGFTVTMPPVEAYLRASRKDLLVQLASELGVLVPKSRVVLTAQDIVAAAHEQGFPAVIKPALSRWLHHGRVMSTVVRVAQSEAELDVMLRQSWVGQLPCVVQQWVPGRGAGVFALYGASGPIAWFAHRRLRERPPSGGVSVLSESVPVDPVLKAHAERLLSALAWKGLAMVEFRVGDDGVAYLMEINGRPWGSMQLAIDAGVDFPWLWAEELTNGKVAPITGYRFGVRVRWFLGDVDNLFMTIRDSSVRAQEGLRALCRFGSTSFNIRVHSEVARISDLMPAWTEVRSWLRGGK